MWACQRSFHVIFNDSPFELKANGHQLWKMLRLAARHAWQGRALFLSCGFGETERDLCGHLHGFSHTGASVRRLWTKGCRAVAGWATSWGVVLQWPLRFRAHTCYEPFVCFQIQPELPKLKPKPFPSLLGFKIKIFYSHQLRLKCILQVSGNTDYIPTGDAND